MHVIVNKAGNLEVVKRVDSMTGEELGFMWIDSNVAPGHPLGVGPFISIDEAMQHYAECVKPMKAAFQQPQHDEVANPDGLRIIKPLRGDVIYVDFVARKRIVG